MSRLSPQHHVPLHLMDERMNDRRVKVPRCSATTWHAIRSADNLVNGQLRRDGYDCKRVMLVFVDDHKNADVLSCVVFALSHDLTMVAKVDDNGVFIERTLYKNDCTKRLREAFMYEIAGVKAPSTYDLQREMYSTRVYARNRCCYK